MNANPTLLAALLLATLLPPAGGADAAVTVYRCQSPGGPALFSQFPCAAEAAKVLLEPSQIFGAPPLGATEQRPKHSKDIIERAGASERAAQARRQQETKAQQRCTAARDGLDALARQRRKGYALKDAADLERREAELLAMRRDDC